MPLEDFDGECFVAFVDISGFKSLMRRDKAVDALNALYNNGYWQLQNNRNVCGTFISDCAVLYTIAEEKYMQLNDILDVVKGLNDDVLNQGYMLTTSIAYGHFLYQNRKEFSGILKNAIYGNAYVDAYLDNEHGKPKLQPGQCRIKKTYVDENLLCNLTKRNFLKEKDGCYYFYWNVSNPNQIEEFDREYSDSYNLKYKGMEESLKKYRYENR